MSRTARPRNRRLAIAAALLALPAAAPAALPGACARDDLLPGFERFLGDTAGLAPAPRADAFVRDYAPAHRGFYLLAGVTSLDQLRAPAQAFFAGGAAQAGMRPLDMAALADMARAVDEDFDVIQSRFQRAFPDFRCAARIVFGVSLGRFDGTLVTDASGVRLQFGLDVISRVHSRKTLPALFQHELFHLYHAQVLGAPPPDPIPVWWGMWVEGLATWVSGELNPSLPADQLFWIPPDLAERAGPHRGEIARAMLADIDATGARYQRYFTANEGAGTLPPRAGYYMGYLLADALGHQLAPADLARLTPGQIRPIVAEFLHREAER